MFCSCRISTDNRVAQSLSIAELLMIQYRSVTDTQTHRHTHTHTTTAYTALSIASRGKKVSRDVTTPLSGTV